MDTVKVKSKQNDDKTHPKPLLKRNHLKLIGDIQPKSIYESLSQLVYKDNSKAELIRTCINRHLISFFKSGEFPAEIRFLESESKFLDHFLQYQNLSYIQALSIFLFSHFLQTKCIVLSANQNSSNFFSNIFYFKGKFTLYLFALEQGDKTVYLPVKRTNNDDQQISIAKEALNVIHKKLNDFDVTEAKKTINRFTSIDDSEVPGIKQNEFNPNEYYAKRYKSLFNKHFTLFHDIQSTSSQKQIYQHSVASAKVQLSKMFNKYTMSVNKRIENNQAFFPTEDKEQVIKKNRKLDLPYQDYEPNYFVERDPPGMLIRFTLR